MDLAVNSAGRSRRRHTYSDLGWSASEKAMSNPHNPCNTAEIPWGGHGRSIVIAEVTG